MAKQTISTKGHNNVTIQVIGNGNAVSASSVLELLSWRDRIESRVEKDLDILDPDYQAIPFIGREADLTYLREWLQGDGIAVAAIIGRGGAGKTRLALELLQSVGDDWQAGFLEDLEKNRALLVQNLADWDWSPKTLVVVDYAASLTPELKAWFLRLGRSRQKKCLRILLLERYGNGQSGWFHNLTDGANSSKGARKLFRQREPREISRIDDLSQRRTILEAGLAVLAELDVTNGKRSAPVLRRLPTIDAAPWFAKLLAHEQWSDPLLLLMAAVLCHASGVRDALDLSQVVVADGFGDDVQEALGLSRVTVSRRVASREIARLRMFGQDTTEKTVLVHLYACVILCGELTRDQAIEIARGECESLGLQYKGGVGRAVRDLEGALGANGVLRRLRPDLLAEAILLEAEEFQDGNAIRRISNFAPRKLAEILILTARDFAIADDRPLRWLNTIVEHGNEHMDVLTEIEGSLPLETVVMRELATTVSRRLVDNARAAYLADGSATSAAIFARFLHNYSLRLGQSGDLSGALEAITEAVLEREKLYSQHPKFFGVELVGSLNTLANRQSALGQPEAALETIKKAVKLARRLNAEDPEAATPALAMSLNNLSNWQSVTGQRKAALRSIKQSVRLRRKLYRTNPDAVAVDLGTALNNLSNWQSEMGQSNAALRSIREAVGIWRKLYAGNPDAFASNLAGSLSNMSIHQGWADKPDAALASAEESVVLFRDLYARNSDSFRSGLASGLNNLAVQQRSLGHHKNSLISIREAVRLWRKLYAGDAAAFCSDLASSLHNLSNAQSAVGLRKAALASIKRAVHLRRNLYRKNPRAYSFDLAMSLSVLGDRCEELLKIGEGRKAAEEALQILAEDFLLYPKVVGGLVKVTIADYIRRSIEQGLERNVELLSSYKSVIEEGGP